MVWYQELGVIQMNTVKKEKAWDEETTLSRVKSQPLLTLAFQVVLLKVKQILEQLKRRKLDCECASVRKSFPLPSQDAISECCFGAPAGAELHWYHFRELIELLGAWRRR